MNDLPSTVCRFYLAGNCAYGDACRYDHARPQWHAASQQPDRPRPTLPLCPKPLTDSHGDAAGIPKHSAWGAEPDPYDMGSMALSLPYAVDPNECPADDEADALDDDIAGSWEDEAATERISSALHTGVGGAGSLGHDVPSTSLAAAGRWTGSQG
eukprot:CAMPEP_0202907334 /NCGR_PEP_ID=MMETSP1392-20130828/42164_1 /ASSEMBLY_ACC=CAM_ASM_000868 /TAXON_ID=225041 /ORGANISM="Chlamydomonas chlamydogama, Strain SAG 11-48b" /LENGTH=154 /DNA_ID=CAMNT_0049596171 /DNA_START=74 /DNA_END=534 /DNA_ORIENTATION=-